jgi:hypothetical protein
LEYLRTGESRFEDLPGYPFEPHYSLVPDLEGETLRMQYLDEGGREHPLFPRTAFLVLPVPEDGPDLPRSGPSGRSSFS